MEEKFFSKTLNCLVTYIKSLDELLTKSSPALEIANFYAENINQETDAATEIEKALYKKVDSFFKNLKEDMKKIEVDNKTVYYDSQVTQLKHDLAVTFCLHNYEQKEELILKSIDYDMEATIEEKYELISTSKMVDLAKISIINDSREKEINLSEAVEKTYHDKLNSTNAVMNSDYEELKEHVFVHYLENETVEL